MRNFDICLELHNGALITRVVLERETYAEAVDDAVERIKETGVDEDEIDELIVKSSDSNGGME